MMGYVPKFASLCSLYQMTRAFFKGILAPPPPPSGPSPDNGCCWP